MTISSEKLDNVGGAAISIATYQTLELAFGLQSTWAFAIGLWILGFGIGIVLAHRGYI